MLIGEDCNKCGATISQSHFAPVESSNDDISKHDEFNGVVELPKELRADLKKFLEKEVAATKRALKSNLALDDRTRKPDRDDSEMTAASNKGGLEILEKSDLDLSQLVDHASDILKFDLAATRIEDLEDLHTTAEYTFREQWVLKWLVKQLGSLQQRPATSQSSEHEANFTRQLKPWILLLRLLCTIPASASAEILAERKFVQTLDNGVRTVLKFDTVLSQHSGVYVQSTAHSANAEDAPRKRRRLSTDEKDGVKINGDAANATDTMHVVFLVCQKFSGILASHSIPGGIGGQYVVSNWSASSGQHASLLAAALEAGIRTTKETPNRPLQLQHLSQIKKLLSIWTARPVLVSESAKAEEVEAFNAHCLSPCLQLLSLCDTMSDEVCSKALRSEIEKLLALHTVIPLRTRFNERLSKGWKKDRKCLSWKDVEPVYDDFAAMLCLGTSESDEDLAESNISGSRAVLHHLYSIAFRLIPKTDVRRRQWEQPWLDALMIVLCYVSSPQLARLISTSSGASMFDKQVTSSRESTRVEPLCGLLEVAISQRINLSLQLLSYLSAAVLSTYDLAEPWRPISKIVILDINVLVPGLGIPTTEQSLDLLVNRIAGYSIDETSYTVLRDGILLPLITGFGRSRALRDFVSLCKSQVTAAMRVESEGFIQDTGIPAILVWQDEDTFDRVTEVVRQHSTSNLIQEVLDQSLRNMRELDENPDSLPSLMCDVSICGAFIRALDNATPFISRLEEIQSAALETLSRPNYYCRQRWRLWNLINAIQSGKLLDDLTTTFLSLDDPDGGSLAILDIQQSVTTRGSPSSLWMERFERFSLLVQQASRRSSNLNAEVGTELDALYGHATALSGQTATWNGRYGEMANIGTFVAACFTRLLAEPKVLRLCPQLIIALCQQINHMNPMVTDLLMAFINSECLDWKSKLAGELIESLLHPAVGDNELNSHQPLIEATMTIMSFGAMPKSRLTALASRLLESLTSKRQTLSSRALASHLAVLEKINSTSNSSFCEPDSWLDWCQMVTELESREVPSGDSSLAIASRCMTAILQKLMRAIFEKSAKSDGPLLQILKWCEDGIEQFLDRSPSNSCDLGIHVAITSIWSAREQLTPYVSAISIEALMTSYGEALVTALNGVHKSDALFAGRKQSAICGLQLLLQIQQLPSFSQDLVQSTGTVVESLRDGLSAEYEELEILLLQFLLRLNPSARGNAPGIDVLTFLNSFCPTQDVLDYKQMISVARKADQLIQKLDSDGQADLLDLLVQPSWQDEPGLLVEALTAAVILQADRTGLIESHRLVEHFAAVASLHRVSKVSDPARILLSLENAGLILEHHSKIVNQSTIDTLFANLGRLLSSSSVAILDHSTVGPSAVYEHICSLLGIVLSRFRRRLSDRHHLLLPVLQGLLRCLFYSGSNNLVSHLPAQGSNPAALLRSLPKWLVNSTRPFSAASAQELSRIISSIANPSPSAAKSSFHFSKRNAGISDLNDATKQVRTLAGQHLQYLIMEYCRCTLDGEINIKVKEKLMPGLYTILDAMNRDVMRAMNASMDPSARAVFKGLYDDWVRYGKWDKT